MRCIDLYAGIGGFRLGLEGHECIWSNEIDKYARAVYRYHFGECDGRDITTIPPDDIPEADLWTFGTPCQDFSVAGRRRGIEGSRGNLTLYTLELLEIKRPRYFLMENVPGLLSIGGRRPFVYIIGRFVEMGYRVQWLCLNSKDFGVPHNRERLFIIGSLGGEPRPEVFSFSVEDIRTGEVSMKWIGNIHEYDTQFGRVYDSDGIMQTINALVIPKTQVQQHIRRLTPLECERLQGFPDNWTARGIDDDGNEIEISDTQRYKMCGNAVTVNVIRHFARAFEGMEI